MYKYFFTIAALLAATSAAGADEFEPFPGYGIFGHCVGVGRMQFARRDDWAVPVAQALRIVQRFNHIDPEGDLQETIFHKVGELQLQTYEVSKLLGCPITAITFGSETCKNGQEIRGEIPSVAAVVSKTINLSAEMRQANERARRRGRLPRRRLTPLQRALQDAFVLHAVGYSFRLNKPEAVALAEAEANADSILMNPSQAAAALTADQIVFLLEAAGLPYWMRAKFEGMSSRQVANAVNREMNRANRRNGGRVRRGSLAWIIASAMQRLLNSANVAVKPETFSVPLQGYKCQLPIDVGAPAPVTPVPVAESPKPSPSATSEPQVPVALTAPPEIVVVDATKTATGGNDAKV